MKEGIVLYCLNFFWGESNSAEIAGEVYRLNDVTVGFAFSGAGWFDTELHSRIH